MEAVLVTCDGCGSRIRVRNPGLARSARCPRCASEFPLPTVAMVEESGPNPVGAEQAEWPRRRWLEGHRPLAIATLALMLAATALGYAAFQGETAPPGVELVPPGAIPTRAESPDPAPPSVATSVGTVQARSLPPADEPPDSEDEPGKVEKPASTSRQFDSRVEPESSTRPPRASSAEQAPDHGKRAGEPRTRAVQTRPPVRALEVPPPPPPLTEGTDARRILARLGDGRTVVARVHGGTGDNVHIMLPDGQLGIPDKLSFTELPFRPASADEMIAELTSGPFQDFAVHRTARYIILYRSTREFAEASGRVLEDLYKGLLEAFRKFAVPAREAEFPLVAVIFRTEREFREYRPVAPEIQAYYEIYTNRIHFYQRSDRDDQAPEVAAVRKPQTVAHEGTHQILQNIGVQPRLASWPMWLIEGLAEYCSTPRVTKQGTTWDGLGIANAQHLATIRDLGDPLSAQVPGATRPEHIGRPPGMPLVEYLVTKADLTPTDYALAWAMTYFLAMKRTEAFLGYLRVMSAMPPLESHTASEQVAAFQAAFGSDLAKLDREIGAYLAKVKVKDHLPYYAVLFQQRVPGGLVRRSAIVSQSPSMIRQWLDSVTLSRGDLPEWEVFPYATRTKAWVFAEKWMREG